MTTPSNQQEVDRREALRDLAREAQRWGIYDQQQLNDIEAIANQLYVRVINPDTIWWDDLTPEMKRGWLSAALWVWRRDHRDDPPP